MKRVLVLLLMLVALPCYGQQVIPANQVTVSWNESVSVGTLPGTYSYQVFTLPEGLDRSVEANWIAAGEVAGLTSTVTFSVEGKHIVGIRTKRVLADSSVLYSEMNWSDVNGEETPNPFVVFYGINPDKPLNLRVQ